MYCIPTNIKGVSLSKLETFYLDQFPSNSRILNTNFARFYLNLLDAVTQLSIENLNGIDGINTKLFEQQLSRYFKNSIIFNEIRYSQTLLVKKAIHQSRLPLEISNFSFMELTGKIKVFFFKKRVSNNSKFAFLNFDQDFLLDVLLFQLK